MDFVQMETPIEDLMAIRKVAAMAVERGRNLGLPLVDVVEVGSWAGRTALEWLSVQGVRLFCVDHWARGGRSDKGYALSPDGVYRQFCANVRSHLFRRVFPIRASSREAVNLWIDNVIPDPLVVYVDADHDYDNVKADIMAWSQVVRPGGLLLGHDYQIGFGGLDKAVNELVANPRKIGRCIWVPGSSGWPLIERGES